jgi:hypothetical protein
LFSLSFHLIKRLWFWRQCSKFILQGDFSIFYVETKLSSFKGRLASLHWFSCLVLVRKLDSGVRRHDCVNCTHLPDICRVLSVLQVQILDPYFISDRENVDWKNVEHSLRSCSVPLLSLSSPFHTHPVLLILCSLKSSNHLTQLKSQFIHHIILALYIRSCINTRKLFILCWE